MDEGRTIEVHKDFDVIVARSYVRDLARKVGLRTTDQARIALVSEGPGDPTSSGTVADR